MFYSKKFDRKLFDSLYFNFLVPAQSFLKPSPIVFPVFFIALLLTASVTFLAFIYPCRACTLRCSVLFVNLFILFFNLLHSALPLNTTGSRLVWCITLPMKRVRKSKTKHVYNQLYTHKI